MYGERRPLRKDASWFAILVRGGLLLMLAVMMVGRWAGRSWLWISLPPSCRSGGAHSSSNTHLFPPKTTQTQALLYYLGATVYYLYVRIRYTLIMRDM